VKMNNDFTVEAPVEQAWETMLDLERIAPCLPGASVEKASGGGGDEYKGTMTVRLGPVNQKYDGTVSITEADESAHRAVLQADGKDARGQGTASATIVSTMEDDGDGKTKVHVETDMKLTGRAAQFGRGMQQEVATKILNQFAECLEREIMGENVREEPEPEPAAASSSGPSGNGAAQEEEPPRRRIIQQDREVEPLDLGEMSRDAVLKRVKVAAPIAAGVVVVVGAIWLLRRRT
jgi:uncharacterized protein